MFSIFFALTRSCFQRIMFRQFQKSFIGLSVGATPVAWSDWLSAAVIKASWAWSNADAIGAHKANCSSWNFAPNLRFSIVIKSISFQPRFFIFHRTQSTAHCHWIVGWIEGCLLLITNKFLQSQRERSVKSIYDFRRMLRTSMLRDHPAKSFLIEDLDSRTYRKFA